MRQTKKLFDVAYDDVEYLTRHTAYVTDNGGVRRRKVIWTCPYYSAWTGIIQRSFSRTLKERFPTYKDVTCCDEWKYLSNFKRWMEQQEWEGKHLDKDILFPANKMYAPDFCVFVNPITNTFLTASDASRGEWPLGVSRDKNSGRFKAGCRHPFGMKPTYIAYFDTPEEAHEAWRKRKHEYAQLVAELETDPRVVEALKKRYSYEEWYGKG